jgi:metal-dependent amidase/aminoacylase/carboxypeptidase family protein
MARTTGSPNDQALAAFIAAKAEIDNLLAELAALSADHFHANPDEITWSHVGTASHIRDRLQEIGSFAAGNG